jgi:cob(I)alamin adenosyltransferase
MVKGKTETISHKGDDGTTVLSGSGRIGKETMLIEAIGTIDELSAAIAVVKTTSISAQTKSILEKLQDYCYQINVELAATHNEKKTATPTLDESDVCWIDSLIDEFNTQLPKLNHFIVPGTKPSEAFLNLSRTICRRAERRLSALDQQEKLRPTILKFINRLSDLLFVLMRFEAK